MSFQALQSLVISCRSLYSFISNFLLRRFFTFHPITLSEAIISRSLYSFVSNSLPHKTFCVSLHYPIFTYLLQIRQFVAPILFCIYFYVSLHARLFFFTQLLQISLFVANSKSHLHIFYVSIQAFPSLTISCRSLYSPLSRIILKKYFYAPFPTC